MPELLELIMPLGKSPYSPLYSPAAAALCLLTARRRLGRMAAGLGGLDAVLNVLRPHNDPYTLEATCALLVNLVHAAPEAARVVAPAGEGADGAGPDGEPGGRPALACLRQVLEAMENYPGHAPLQQCACAALAALAAPAAGEAAAARAAEGAGAAELVMEALEKHPRHEGVCEEALACLLRFAAPLNSMRQALLRLGALSRVGDAVERFPKNAEITVRMPRRMHPAPPSLRVPLCPNSSC